MLRPFWTRLPSESQESYEAFLIYRDIGPTRTISKVGQRLVKNTKALARLSKKYDWVKRAADYDTFVGQQIGEALAREKADQAKTYQKLSIRLVDELISGLDEGTRNVHTDDLLEYILNLYPIFKESFCVVGRTDKTAEQSPIQTSYAEEASSTTSPDQLEAHKELADKSTQHQSHLRLDEGEHITKEAPETSSGRPHRKKIFKGGK